MVERRLDDLQAQDGTAYLGGKRLGQDWAKEKAELVGWPGVQAIAELLPNLSAEEVNQLIGENAPKMVTHSSQASSKGCGKRPRELQART